MSPLSHSLVAGKPQSMKGMIWICDKFRHAGCCTHDLACAFLASHPNHLLFVDAISVNAVPSQVRFTHDPSIFARFTRATEAQYPRSEIWNRRLSLNIYILLCINTDGCGMYSRWDRGCWPFIDTLRPASIPVALSASVRHENLQGYSLLLRRRRLTEAGWSVKAEIR